MAGRGARGLHPPEVRRFAQAADVAVGLQLAKPELQIADAVRAIAHDAVDPDLQLLGQGRQAPDLGLQRVHALQHGPAAAGPARSARRVQFPPEALQLDIENRKLLPDVGKRLCPVLGQRGRGQDQADQCDAETAHGIRPPGPRR
jgi:hypothetical protein